MVSQVTGTDTDRSAGYLICLLIGDP